MELSAKQIKQYEKKGIQDLVKLATKHFNTYIRKRDDQGGYFTCISCGETKGLSQMNAGHFFSAGHCAALRFNEDNVHGQCVPCNMHLHGNLIRYREGLVKKIGEDKVKLLESLSRTVHRWDRIGLIYTIEFYKAKPTR
ncbi:recombination protein NinG [Chitinophaga sp. YIM B06452]|uniref:recombination protein NinG n=1 Tax=Chitinophaga sp. YIM B06452 TaxID=3082158 RepID=UPI0031FE4B6F